MALGLVARSAVALSAQINAFYRVLKGSDPENVYLRLPSAGSFEVRHSATNAPVFTVTDAGMVGAINGGNIADGTVDTSELKDSAVTSVKIADGSIVNADINPAAAIVPSKLWGGGTADRVLGTTDGTIVAPVLVSSAMLADGAIVNADVNASAAIAYSKLNLAASITSNDIVDGTITNSDVNAAAAVAITKLADVGANNVLRSSGAGNVAGKIVTNDMVINTINGDRITDATILGAKILGGAPPPNGTGAPDAYKVYATAAAGTTVSLQQVASQHLATAAVPQLLTWYGPIVSNQVSFDFLTINQSYKNLRLVVHGRSTIAALQDSVALRFNSVSGAFYYTEVLYTIASTVSAVDNIAGTYGLALPVPGATSQAGCAGGGVVDLPNYASSSVLLVRTWHAVGGSQWGVLAGNIQAFTAFGTLFQAVPITSIVINPVGGSWAPGSHAALYGFN